MGGEGERRPDAVLLAGPTASGKSALAMDWAEREGGAVVNADSMQVHDVLRLVTARPSAEDEARVPHRMYGFARPGEPMSAARYAAAFSATRDELRERGLVPIVVGGTGLYLEALVDGLSPVPPVDAEVRAAVRALATEGGAHAVHVALRRADPAMADRLRPSDTQRLARALEVVRSTGRSLRDWQNEREPGPLAGARLERVLLMPPRPVLHERIARRAAHIVDDPRAHREVERLRELDPEGRTLAARAIGVSQIGDLLDGRRTRDEALHDLVVATRRYAKRQSTWFNNRMRDWRRIDAAPGA